MTPSFHSEKRARIASYNGGDAASCDQLAQLNNLDEKRDQRITALANSCTADCARVVQFINNELRALGCSNAPYACNDALLRQVWVAAQAKAQALQPGFGPDDALLIAYGLLRGGVKIAMAISNAGKEMPIIVTDSLSSTPSSLARQINDFYRDGAPPEIIQRTINQAARGSTHNASAAEVVLGKYIPGSPTSYEAVAQARGSTYFSMSDWSTVQRQLELSNGEMWKINKAFLDQQITEGKSFIFTSNPVLVRSTSYTALEYKHLIDLGFKIETLPGGLFRAIKK